MKGSSSGHYSYKSLYVLHSDRSDHHISLSRGFFDASGFHWKKEVDLPDGEPYPSHRSLRHMGLTWRPSAYSTTEGMSTTRPMLAPQWQTKTPARTSSSETSRSSG